MTTETADTTDLSDLQHANDDTQQSKCKLNTPYNNVRKKRVTSRRKNRRISPKRKRKDESREKWTPFAGRLFNMHGA